MSISKAQKLRWLKVYFCHLFIAAQNGSSCFQIQVNSSGVNSFHFESQGNYFWKMIWEKSFCKIWVGARFPGDGHVFSGNFFLKRRKKLWQQRCICCLSRPPPPLLQMFPNLSSSRISFPKNFFKHKLKWIPIVILMLKRGSPTIVFFCSNLKFWMAIGFARFHRRGPWTPWSWHMVVFILQKQCFDVNRKDFQSCCKVKVDHILSSNNWILQQHQHHFQKCSFVCCHNVHFYKGLRGPIWATVP